MTVWSTWGRRLVALPGVSAFGTFLGLGSGVLTFLQTPSSANLAAALTDETGTGTVVFSSAIREKLTGARTYYVRTDGSDSNTGLANSAGGAFLTLQKAYDVIVQTLDLGGYTVTIQQGTAGALTSGLAISSGPSGGLNVTLDLGGGSLTTTSANCVQITGASAINLTVQNGTLAGVTSATTIYCGSPLAQINTGASLTFGAAPGGGAHFYIVAGTCNVNVAYSVTGAATYHYFAQTGGKIINGAANCTLSGTLAFTTFAFCSAGSLISSFAATYSGGTITGKRFDATNNGVINTFGGGANVFPGNAAGTGTNSGTSPYGLYV
jgi:hypothetical protein